MGIAVRELSPQKKVNFVIEIYDHFATIATPPMPRSLGCWPSRRETLTGWSSRTSDTMTLLKLLTAQAGLGEW